MVFRAETILAHTDARKSDSDGTSCRRIHNVVTLTTRKLIIINSKKNLTILVAAQDVLPNPAHEYHLTVASVPRRIVPKLGHFNWLLKMNNQLNCHNLGTILRGTHPTVSATAPRIPSETVTTGCLAITAVKASRYFPATAIDADRRGQHLPHSHWLPRSRPCTRPRACSVGSPSCPPSRIVPRHHSSRRNTCRAKH